MRSNGFPLVLATLLMPAGVLAQVLPPAPSASAPQASSAAPAEAINGALAGTSQDTAPQASPAEPGQPTAPTAEPVPDAASPPAPAAPEATTGTGPLVQDPRAAPAGEPQAEPAAPVQAPAVDPASPVPAASDPTVTPADPAALPPTQAEEEFADIYGEEYDPVADPTLPEPVLLPGAYDPWEKYNRQMHRFNNAVDRGVARPMARGYVKVVPRPLRLGVSNFFSNLGQPLAAVNSLLQGKPKQAGQAMGRFLLNSTLGIGGIFDPASDAKLPHRNEDFGQTLGVWGWKRSRYVELPLFGPRTVRDVFGMVGDAPLSPLRNVEADNLRVPLQGLQLVDLRAQLLSTDSLREGAEDDYTLVRDAWSMRRDYQIFGDKREKDGDTTLPDYLLESDDEPTVPIDAMPVPPTGGGS